MTINIKNPMVIVIAIGFYDEDPKEKDTSGYLLDLDGVRHDIDNMIQLFGINQNNNGLNYDIFPSEYYQQNIESYTAWWTRDKLMNFLNEQANILEDNLLSESISSDDKYDGLLVIISCHGIEERFINK